MDAFARGLKNAAKMLKDREFEKIIQKRYANWDTAFGRKIEKRQIGFRELEEYTLKNGEPRIQSGRQELLENLLNEYAL